MYTVGKIEKADETVRKIAAVNKTSVPVTLTINVQVSTSMHHTELIN